MRKDRSFTFKQFEIKSNIDGKTVDLRGSGNPVIEYRESIFMPYVEISAYIIDTGNTFPADDGTDAGVGLLDAGFGQGTETIKFKLADEKGHVIDLSKDSDLRVASIKGDYQAFKNQSFLMTIVSKEAFDNTLLKNRVGGGEEKTDIKYSGKISSIARSIIKENLKSPKAQSMNVDETLNEYNGFGQDRTPFEMILDLQKLAIPNVQTSKGKSAKGNTAGYLFFQTSLGYQFRSLDKLFDLTYKTVPRYIENSRADEGVPIGYDGKILWSNISQSVDALSQFENGAWASKIYVFNDVTKKADIKTLQSDGKGNGITAGRHLPKINKDYLDSDGKPLPTQKQIVRQAVGQTVKGFDSIEKQVEKTDQINYNNEEIILQAHQNYRQKMNTSVEIIIEADLSLNAGDLIYCEFPELSTKVTTVGSRTRKSGIYMIADLCHYGDVGNSFTGLHLVRDAYGAKPEQTQQVQALADDSGYTLADATIIAGGGFVETVIE
tara:strand:- start:554 stop:2032 length:1479 start_codon:yes stop_codon:yes gene_type:complete